MANAKIISIANHEIRLAAVQARSDLDTRLLNISTKIMVLDIALGKLRDQLNAAGDKATSDLRFVTVNLRHDINTLAAAVNKLRQDLDQLKQGGEGPPTSA